MSEAHRERRRFLLLRDVRTGPPLTASPAPGPLAARVLPPPLPGPLLPRRLLSRLPRRPARLRRVEGLPGPRQAVGRLAGAGGRLAHRPGVARKASGGPTNG